jgi:hypothetical protein
MSRRPRLPGRQVYNCHWLLIVICVRCFVSQKRKRWSIDGFLPIQRIQQSNLLVVLLVLRPCSSLWICFLRALHPGESLRNGLSFRRNPGRAASFPVPRRVFLDTVGLVFVHLRKTRRFVFWKCWCWCWC